MYTCVAFISKGSKKKKKKKEGFAGKCRSNMYILSSSLSSTSLYIYHPSLLKIHEEIEIYSNNTLMSKRRRTRHK